MVTFEIDNTDEFQANSEMKQLNTHLTLRTMKVLVYIYQFLSGIVQDYRAELAFHPCFSDGNLFGLTQITSTIIIIKISVVLKYHHSTVQGGSKGGVILNDLYHKRLR